MIIQIRLVAKVIELPSGAIVCLILELHPNATRSPFGATRLNPFASSPRALASRSTTPDCCSSLSLMSNEEKNVLFDRKERYLASRKVLGQSGYFQMAPTNQAQPLALCKT